MALIPLIIAAGMAGLTALNRALGSGTTASNYPAVPSISIVDPSIWPAGTAASRRSRGASGAPNGQKWQSATQFATALPTLIGR